MPLLFAVTLFVSASLLFMVQPMVGKMVLPLLGGSPAVWNACMVFFQALLLLGYLYAHHVSTKMSIRRQWALHMLVLGLPLGAFALAILFGLRHSPIAIAESLAPTGESSPILSVLGLLTVAIGIPFFVVSTSAPLLQKWFAETGHPSARDPYFLYAASNAGSLISLLGYPLVIEPNMTIVGQAWVFAGGFVLLLVLVFFCGRAAANPIGVPPGAAKAQSEGTTNAAVPPAHPGEPPPTFARKAKWVALAFVPSSLMLGVTFYMTTDIASIPLLWVIPLALYLVTFIIAFGRVPSGFRVVIGNLAPVMILLLVFVMISGVNPGVGINLLLHILTFFAAALMCHYELARDRPSVEYLTEFFLLMSIGGVLGGIFNSLVAPLIFPDNYEYKVALIIACLMVPRLIGGDEKDADGRPLRPAEEPLTTGRQAWYTVLGAILAPVVCLVEAVLAVLNIGRTTTPAERKPAPAGKATATAPPPSDTKVELWLAVGSATVFLALSGFMVFGSSLTAEVLITLIPIAFLLAARFMLSPFDGAIRRNWEWVGQPRRSAMLDGAVPVVVLGGYYLLRRMAGQEWFYNTATETADGLGLDYSIIRTVVVFALPVMVCFFFVDRPVRFALSVAAILGYSTYAATPDDIIRTERSFFGILKIESDVDYQRPVFKTDAGKTIASGKVEYHKLVHGTTLHGTQIFKLDNNVFDMFQAMSALNPWENVVVAGANHAFTPREEPLTYYHRTGPVGAMFKELRTRKNGADALAPFAMVGLGTGSASCYVRPGQKLVFYEIDPAVKRLVADTPEYFTYVTDARARARSAPGGDLDIRMGDARLKLKDTDDKYALLLVDAFSSDSIPVHLLTVEAVQLYLDRLTDDGILALHISNKFVKLEPVVAAIASQLGLTARVWNDDNERRGPGKTASSWVVLARKPEHLGSLYVPEGDLLFARPVEPGAEDRMRVYMDNQLVHGLIEDYDELSAVSRGRTKYKELNDTTEEKDGKGPRAAWLEWLDEKAKTTTDPWEKQRLARYRELIKDYGPHESFQKVMLAEHGHAFRRLETREKVPAWTDDYSDVMRVMMIPELQKLRKFFGLPTPIDR